MAPAGGGDETGESGGPPMNRGVDRSAAGGGQNLGAESGSRKRNAAVMSKDLTSLVGNGEHSKVACEDSQRILMEVEDLRAQLDVDVKELGYCEANQKLRVELAQKAKEMQCLRKQNEGMRKQDEDLQAKNDGMMKQNKDLQAKNDVLVKENEELRSNIDGISKQNLELQIKNGGLTKWNEELLAKNGSLTKQNEELKAKDVDLVKQNEEVQANNDRMRKRNGELHAENAGLTKRNEGLQVKNEGLTESNEKLQAKNDRLTKWIGELEDKNDDLEDLNGTLVSKERQSNDELLQARKELTMGLEDELNGRPAIGTKRMGELDEKPFQNACKRKYGNVDYQTKAAKLVESWQGELKKPSWHPFVAVQVNGEHKEVLDEDDAKLKLLRFEYGDDVCNAVKTALMEINEYNPSERHVVPVFWNFRKGRKATMKEVLYLYGQMEMITKRRRG
ncbi:hypothetical protein SEVIR_5G100200v4 [Setaria viridis]|uniref:Factor of DNA methylation 1-5/IDN2 domain-containing protein n=1 Tax=Setaria viridis TaxID=4556 RepID=A0A4U6UFM4_SETVI|nr:factor of DNA methylation 1-like isoform X2 [Setaria viridis]TKW13423.1 hypothetical protein SEVIR_5G100200v2 [Setaria viridis]TKW13424.1 hypothetical protein SEVIR_5G100200v2 [Setaria viridis]